MDATSFDEPVRAGRAGYAALIGVPVDSVAMAGSVSAALGLVAAAIPDGSRVATLSGEFTSTTFPFAAQAGRGVTVTELDPDELVTAAGDYDVVTASLVQSANGAVFDVDALRATVADTDTVTVIDVTQAVGWKQVDLPWADVTVAAVYKWLLAPRGTAWMSLSDRACELDDPACRQLVRGGGAVADASTGCRCGWPKDARRFDASPAWFSALGAGLTLPWLASLDRDAVEAHTSGWRVGCAPNSALPPEEFGDRLDPDRRRRRAEAGGDPGLDPRRGGARRLPPLQHRGRPGPVARRVAVAVVETPSARVPSTTMAASSSSTQSDHATDRTGEGPAGPCRSRADARTPQVCRKEPDRR